MNDEGESDCWWAEEVFRRFSTTKEEKQNENRIESTRKQNAFLSESEAQNEEEEEEAAGEHKKDFTCLNGIEQSS